MISKHQLKQIWQQVPVNYYQQSIKKNLFQRKWHINKLKIILCLIPNSPKKILDVGCASGWLLSEISKEHDSAKCYGIDVFSKAIKFGKKKYPNLILKTADGHKIPYENNYFNLVICSEVLEHVIDPEKVILEIKRVMKKNGTAIIEMDTGNLLFNLIWIFWTHFFGHVWSGAHLHKFNQHKLEKLITSAGFTIQKRQVFNFGMAVVFQCTV